MFVLHLEHEELASNKAARKLNSSTTKIVRKKIKGLSRAFGLILKFCRQFGE